MRERKAYQRLLLGGIVLALAAGAFAQAPVGPRPEQFKYPPLDFKIPKPADFRTTLSNGLIVYIAEDHEIPWFSGSLMVRTGPFLEPKDKLGVAGLTNSIMRSGGTTTMTGEQINERMDFLAGTVTATSLSIHTRHFDEGLKIWMDILLNPAFPEDRLRREKDAALPMIRNRNRNISQVAARTYEKLIYGEDSPITAEQTEAVITGIARNDLVAWHKKYWGANNAILVVSGDFKKADMLKKLEATFGKWRKAEKAVPPIPKVAQASKAGVYMVQPEGQTPNQGIIRMGHLGLKTDDPDYPAVDLMNYVLGGGSFSSRITKIVRTDNGLAYSTSSSFGGGGGGQRGGGGGTGGGILYPGTFTASCQTKNSTVVFASQLMLDIIEGLRAGDISEADLKMAKSAGSTPSPPSRSSPTWDRWFRASPPSSSTAGPRTTTRAMWPNMRRSRSPTSSGWPRSTSGPTKWSSWLPATSRSAGPERTSSSRTRRRSTPWRPSSAAARSTDWPRNTVTERSTSSS